MVKHAHIHQRQCLHQPARQLHVGTAWFGNARGMIVGQNYRRCIVMQGASHHFTRVHTRAINGAAKQFLKINDPVTVVQEQAGEHFIGKVSQAAGKVLASCIRIFQRTTTLHLFLQVAACYLHDSLQLRIRGLSESAVAAKALPVCLQQRSQTTKLAQQVSCQINGRFTRYAGAQEDGQQFSVRQCGRTVNRLSQAITWSIVSGFSRLTPARLVL